MAITLRHDAAAVALPSSSSTRKYGQQLVLQQQQQKYAAQQAGYDRMFDAYKQNNQNQFQFARDQFQNDMAFRRENRQNDFVLGRDKALFDQQQQMQEAERQRAFMEDARKMSSGMIMDDIQNGNYDPATARQLQQNLVAESEALGNPQYDATQRAEALQKIRAARALLTSNRLQKPPPPTPDEEIAGLPEVNGTKYQKNKNGVWEPLQPSKQQQQQQEKQQQEIEAMRPKSAQEYYGQNEDKFQKDLDSTMKSMQSEFDLGTRKEPVTQEAAWEKMQKDYEFRQKSLGKPQYGEPTVAGQADPGAAPPVSPGTERSILEPSQAPPQPGAAPATPGEPSSILDAPIPSQQDGLKAEYHAEMTAKGYQLVTPPDGGRPYYYHPGPNNTPEATPQAQESARVPYSPPRREIATPAAQNKWEEVAVPPTPAASQPTAAQPAGSAPIQSPSAQASAPDFNALSGSAKNNTDRAVVDGMKGIYSQQPPQVQSAIAVYLDPNSSEQDFTNALKTLLANGIDPQQMQPPIKGHWDAMNDTNKSLSGVR